MKTYSVFFCLVALLTLGAATTFAQDVKEVKKTLPLNAGGVVRIDTFKGSVTVTAGESREVEIYAKIEADGQTADEKKLVQQTEVRIDASTDAISIKSDYDRIEQGQNIVSSDDNNSFTLPLIHYTIKMPRTARLMIDDHKSKISVSDLQGELTIDTHKGSVAVLRQGGGVHLETHKGDARVEFASLGKESSFETHKGEIEIVVPKQSGFELDSEIGRGASFDTSYDLHGLQKEEDKRDTIHRGSVNGGGPRLSVNSYKGQIRLKQS